MEERTKIAQAVRECSHCRFLNELQYKFCQSCGLPLEKKKEPQVEPAKKQDTKVKTPKNKGQNAKNQKTTVLGSYSPIKKYILNLLDEKKNILEEYSLEQSTVFGREEGDILIPDVSVSRKHCSIEIEGEKLSIKDLESKNGVFVRIREEYELRPGDEIRIGYKLFRIEESKD